MENKIRSFWWGRTLPERYKHISLSNLTIEDIVILNKLRSLVLTAEELGVDLGWGKQVTIEDTRI